MTVLSQNQKKKFAERIIILRFFLVLTHPFSHFIYIISIYKKVLPVHCFNSNIMAHESKLRNEVGISLSDEHSRLTTEGDSHYGSTNPTTSQSSNTSSSSLLHSEEVCSDHDSSEEVPSVSVANRKKKRLQKHHRPSRPKLVSTLSHIVRSARQSEDEEDEGDVIEMPPDDLIIPELDPKYNTSKN